jgi:hypothetical protein
MSKESRSLRPKALAFALALAGVLRSPLASADDSAVAQALFDQAKKAMAAHRFADACPKLEESLRLQEAVGTLFNLAYCYEHEGKIASAWSRYLEVSNKARAAGQEARARTARERAAVLAPKLSNLVIDVATGREEGLEIRRDGTLVGSAEWGVALPVDAGTHTIEASAPGRKAWSDSVVVTEGATTARVSVPDLERIPAPSKESAIPAPPVESAPRDAPTSPREPSPGKALKVTAVVVGSLGVAGVGAGAVFGLLSLVSHNDASKRCPPPGPCADQAGVDAWRRAYDFGNVADVAFVVGGVGLAAGAVLWFVAANPRSLPWQRSAKTTDTAATLIVGPASIGCRGVW